MFWGSVCVADHGLARLVEAYRAHGHKAAKINPLLPEQPVVDSVPEIDTLAGTITGLLNTSGTYMTAAYIHRWRLTESMRKKFGL